MSNFWGALQTDDGHYFQGKRAALTDGSNATLTDKVSEEGGTRKPAVFLVACLLSQRVRGRISNVAQNQLMWFRSQIKWFEKGHLLRVGAIIIARHYM